MPCIDFSGIKVRCGGAQAVLTVPLRTLPSTYVLQDKACSYTVFFSTTRQICSARRIATFHHLRAAAATVAGPRQLKSLFEPSTT